uniref:Uncharacterized protein n=1 Tax=Arundo donax TaxID=35708 RepID=A0A0A9A9T9_ARUDO
MAPAILFACRQLGVVFPLHAAMHLINALCMHGILDGLSKILGNQK